MEKKKRNKILRRIGRVLLVFLVFFVALVLFIRSPWGQGIIVSKVTDFVSEKTGTEVNIDRLFLTFSGNLSLEGLYLEDKKGDTLVFSKALEADVGLSQIIFGNTFNLEYLEWEGLKANVTRQEGSEDFNFSFLADAFASQDSVPAPEEDAEPMEVNVGTIDLKDFDIVYDDGFLGIDAKLRLGRLYTEANTIDLEAMRFELDELQLTDTEAVYEQTKPFPETEDTTETALPYLAVDNFNIERVKANYSSVPDSLTADVAIGNFLLELPKADLAKSDIEVESLELKDSDISLRMAAQTPQTEDSVAVADAGEGFEWPEFTVQVDQIDFEDNNFAYTTGNNRPKAGKFNPDAVAISNFILQANDIVYRPKTANLDLGQLAFTEKSGFQLKEFSFDARLEDNSASLSDLQLRTNNSSVSGDISLDYSTVDALMETPENAEIEIDIPNLKLALQDAYVFQPDLADNEYLKKAAQKAVTGNFEAKGTLASLEIPTLELDWGEGTSLKAIGQLDNATEPDALAFDFETIRMTSAREDVLQFISEDSLGISVPETMQVDASAQGSVDAMDADVLLQIPEGTVQLAGSYSNRQTMAFDGRLKVDSLRLDKILKNAQLGGVTFTIDAEGSGGSLSTLNATLESDFTQLSFDDYDFSNLELNGDIVDGQGDIHLAFKDDNLNLKANTQVDLDSTDSQIKLDLNLIGADLQALGVTQEDIRTGIKLNAEFKGNADSFDLNALLSEGTAVYENDQYKLGDVDLSAVVREMGTEVRIESEFLKGDLKANASPDQLLSALQDQFEGYFSEGKPLSGESDAAGTNALTRENGDALTKNEFDQIDHADSGSGTVTNSSDNLDSGIEPDNQTVAQTYSRNNSGAAPQSATDTISGPVTLNLNAGLTTTPILREVFLKGLDRLDTIVVKADFNAATKKLSAGLNVPIAEYGGTAIDSLEVLINGGADNLDFSAGFAGIQTDPIDIKRTIFEGKLKNRRMYLDFSSFDGPDRLIHVGSNVAMKTDTIHLHIAPEELIFNKKKWSIPEDNRIAIGDGFLDFTDFRLSQNGQQLTVSNSLSDIDREHIGVSFDKFALQTILSLLNPDDALAGGLVEGRVVVENPFGASGLVADLNINDLRVLQARLGNLALKAASQGQNSYDFDLALKEGGVDFDLTGDYTASETGAELNLDLDLNRLELSAAEALSQGAIKQAEGFVSGNVQVSGTTTEPEYQGEFAFNQVAFNVTTLNSVFKIDNETLRLDNSGLYLDSFDIADKKGDAFTVDGNILTESLINPEFDLNLKADAFQVLNSTEEDNELYYGKASFDADMTVKGNLNLPNVEGRLRIRKVTDITYVVPEATLDVQERDGVVIFVNHDNPDAILTRKEQEETSAFFKGMDVQVVLEIANDAVFHVIMDQKTGDNLEVSGDAELNLNIEPSGRIGLSGRYELNDGHYETSLYNLVNRRFDIKPGSTVTWRGDPMDAALDVTAVYKVETSAAPLMSTVTSGANPSVAGKYRQVLPFLVYLYVEGELLQPKLSFGMDMPEDEQGALGGAVYGRVKQLNEQEGELNRQVFSLLALNRFFPGSGSDGSGGGTAAMARDNVNKVLSGQMNAFSDKVFGNTGIDLNFDLDSFTDYQGDSPQDRTQLDIEAQKKLFDDRLIVSAGSSVDVEGSASENQGQTPLIGNVSLEYLLTENGRYRLRGYRKNEYTNVIDGQLIVTGLALIFNREFNEFSELFNPLKDEEENGADIKTKDSDTEQTNKKHDTEATEDNEN
ncbi:translocation/assembly module TamB domain-containing protein [Pricia sp. S334]|uniref:Translocation/assembly module TamB domain-containing protein n=1 Tax=Pricia mediterranea TaxID=3076079 RepID=A0ABU3L6K1_9FLAO|nr:translocation/assembly module TamB domain-containing protein [Pricia sp. S334]MDT7829379.1 translocation/assembly module TamB domain-containing protein [Pricia sp. S334]